MPRIRSIKPEAFQDVRLGSVSLPARALWVVLLTLTDDYGRFPANVGTILGHGYPHMLEVAPEIPAWLDELEAARLIVRYTAGDEAYGWFPRFRDHQVINRVSKKAFPAPPHGLFTEPSTTTHARLTEDSVSHHGNAKTPVETGLTEDSVSPQGPDLQTTELDLGTGISSSGDGRDALDALRAIDLDTAAAPFADAWPKEGAGVLDLLAQQPEAVQRSVADYVASQAPEWASKGVRFWVEFRILPAALERHESDQAEKSRRQRRVPGASGATARQMAEGIERQARWSEASDAAAAALDAGDVELARRHQAHADAIAGGRA